MSRTVDYYIAPISPWSYLGHQRFTAVVKATGASVRVRPFDIGAVFAASGGVPNAQRPAQRQAYRLVEIARFSTALEIPMHLHPKFFPVPGDAAARLIIAVERFDGQDAALRITGAVFAAVWAQERDIANQTVLSELLAECGLAAERAQQAQAPDIQALYEEFTRQAIEAQVFGAPSYVIDGEIFWGQDRLDFVRKALGGQPSP
ncbi:2-hydroxychromene-2-carboxylate isomerase [Pantoea sp. 18069]|uniref:2-hydroxychromene-2-carboxylate isomerase n=1 Tax=Pantoea sp. 18069 TaxID=2681415 RepID=UPI00135BEA0D|nr:2-hydroxychromene-2-carboxylate isomerase [Pantoea sp. 18069]